MNSLWIVLGLVAAFTLATSDALTKRALTVHNEYVIAWLRLVLSLPVLLPALFFVPVPPLDFEFYVAGVLSVPMEIIALILYVRALRLSPLSLTLPFLSLTPVFLIVIPYLVLGERISLIGAAGVLLIAAGGYVLNIREYRKGLLEPFMAIKKEKGALLMIAVAFIYSITSTLGKMAVEHSHPVFFAAVYYPALVAAFTPVVIYKARHDLYAAMRSGAVKAALIPGILYGVMATSHMIGISLTDVAYLISVKRLSLLIGVVYGHVLFRESGMKERIAGATIMLAGFIMIVLFH